MAQQGYAYGQYGPTVQNAGFYQNKSAGSTPQGNALNQAQTPNWLTTLNNVQASTPLQSTTTSHPDGTSVTHKFQSLDPSQTTSGIGMSMAPTGNANTGGGGSGGAPTTSTTPQTGTNPGMITPTTNADGSFTASDGSFHAANSPEAQNNKTMGSNATPPVQTPPPPVAPAQTTPFNTSQQNLGTSSNNSYNQGSQNVQSGTNMIQNQINNPNPNIAQAQKGLLDIAANQTPDVINAKNEYSTFAKASPYLTGNVGNNVAAEVASGRGQILGNELSQEQNALSQNVTNALAGQNQQITAGTNAGSQGLTGQSQGITAGSDIANTGTTQQSAGITGLGTQGGLIKPSPTAQGQTTYDPMTNSFSGGSYQDNLSTVVQAIKDGRMGYTNGVDSLSGLSPTAKADVLKALGPGFDTVTSDAQATAKGSNVQTIGTANVNSLPDLTKQLNSLQSQSSGIDNNFNLAINTAIKGGVNDGDVPALNAIKQNVTKGLASNQTVIDFQNSIQQIQNVLTATGGGTVDPNISQNGLKSLQQQIKSGIANTVKGIQDQIDKIKGGGSSGSGGSYTSSSGKSYTLPY